MSSGPAPRASEPTDNTGTGNANANSGAAGARPGETTAVSSNGEAGGSGSGERKTEPSVSAAGHTYDKGYGKWAKFDIDAALRDVDGEEDAGTDEKV